MYTKEDLIKDMKNNPDKVFIAFGIMSHASDKHIGPHIFSNYHNSPFTAQLEDASLYEFCCPEQYITYWKAIVSKDYATADTTLLIHEANGYVYRRLGNHINNFNENRWHQMCLYIAYIGMQEKFRQHPEYKQYLISTDDAILVLEGLADLYWSAGLFARSTHFKHPEKWPGENMMGFLLMHLRKNFIEDKEEQNEES